MEAFGTALREFISALREQLIRNGSAEWLTLARLTREASLAFERLSEPTQQALLNALRSAHPLNEDTLPTLLEAFGAYQKAIGRAAAQADRWRYPTPRDLLLANERMSLAPPRYDADRLERALLVGMLTPPDAEAEQRASALYDALNTLQPFEEYNRSTALMTALAFLLANGFRFELTPDEAVQRLRADHWQPLPIQPAETTHLSPFATIIELLVARYRDALGRAEHALRESNISSPGVPPVQRTSSAEHALPATVQAQLQPAPGPASRWRYLTVQDLIWINTEIMGAPQPYNYDRLEEATYYQYSYRRSMDVPLQSARFLWGYLTYRPFAKGNLATALIGVLTFLEINGFEVHLPPDEAVQWLLDVAQRRTHPLSAIRQIITPNISENRSLPVRDVAHHLIERYESALHTLEID